MIQIQPVFWHILGLGCFVPAILIIIFNVITLIRANGSYEVDMSKLGVVYFIALLGISMYYGIQ